MRMCSVIHLHMPQMPKLCIYVHTWSITAGHTVPTRADRLVHVLADDLRLIIWVSMSTTLLQYQFSKQQMNEQNHLQRDRFAYAAIMWSVVFWAAPMMRLHHMHHPCGPCINTPGMP
jgi:hypothetical protein